MAVEPNRFYWAIMPNEPLSRESSPRYWTNDMEWGDKQKAIMFISEESADDFIVEFKPKPTNYHLVMMRFTLDEILRARGIRHE